jgi:predicted dehydrogenase
MYRVNIFGAGSIGNHLAHAFRSKDWEVTIGDIDPKALERTKRDIYKSRYGEWDEAIKLADSRELISEPADIVFIGTPPDTHARIALEVLRNFLPKVLLVEKPFCGPDLDGCQEVLEAVDKTKTLALIGYNHTLAKSCILAEKLIQEGILGNVETISCRTREYWGGIFSAHPWLTGPQDSYLGFYLRGGGAIGEHSHGINLWQHFAHLTGAGRVIEVSSKLAFVEKSRCCYDKLGIATFMTESGLMGDLIQDVVTFPSEKLARVQGDNGFVEMRVNFNTEGDAVLFGRKGYAAQVERLAKTRADDFKQEVDHIELLLTGRTVDSPISLERGLATMVVIAAIFKSNELRRPVEIDWSRGFVLEAIK